MPSHRWIAGLATLVLLFAGCSSDPPKPPMSDKEIEDNTELNIDIGTDANPGDVLPAQDDKTKDGAASTNGAAASAAGGADTNATDTSTPADAPPAP
jgi:hypothetical protein